MHSRERGFVALISVIVISAILLLMVYLVGAASFFNRFDTLAEENKRISLGLAEACLQSGALKIMQGGTVTNQCVSLGGICGGSDPQRVCKICSTTYLSGVPTVKARAKYNGSYSNLQMQFSTSSGSMVITGWVEFQTGDVSCAVP